MVQTQTYKPLPFFTWLSAWLTPAAPTPAFEQTTNSGTGAPNEETPTPLPDEPKEEYIVYLPLFVP